MHRPGAESYFFPISDDLSCFSPNYMTLREERNARVTPDHENGVRGKTLQIALPLFAVTY